MDIRRLGTIYAGSEVYFTFFFFINNIRMLLIIRKLPSRVHWGCTMGAIIKKQKNNGQEK